MKKLWILLIASFVIFSSFEIDNRTEKKLKKDIKNVWGIKEYNLLKIRTDSLPLGDDIFKLVNNDSIYGFVYLGQANSRSEKIDYSVIYDLNASIKKVTVTKYRENYGGEIGSKRWLKQFIGKSNGQEMRYRKEISAISGATISVKEMIHAINKTSTIVYKNKDLFNGFDEAN